MKMYGKAKRRPKWSCCKGHDITYMMYDKRNGRIRALEKRMWMREYFRSDSN